MIDLSSDLVLKINIETINRAWFGIFICQNKALALRYDRLKEEAIECQAPIEQ